MEEIKGRCCHSSKGGPCSQCLLVSAPRVAPYKRSRPGWLHSVDGVATAGKSRTARGGGNRRG